MIILETYTSSAKSKYTYIYRAGTFYMYSTDLAISKFLKNIIDDKELKRLLRNSQLIRRTKDV